jgi:hypothetical protein
MIMLPHMVVSPTTYQQQMQLAEDRTISSSSLNQSYFPPPDWDYPNFMTSQQTLQTVQNGELASSFTLPTNTTNAML